MGIFRCTTGFHYYKYCSVLELIIPPFIRANYGCLQESLLCLPLLVWHDHRSATSLMETSLKVMSLVLGIRTLCSLGHAATAETGHLLTLL